MNYDHSRVVIRSVAAMAAAAMLNSPAGAQGRIGSYDAAGYPREILRGASPDRGPFDPATRRVQTVPVYFPPNPPPLGVQFLEGGVPQEMGTPAELASYVTEHFYVPLGVRLRLGLFSSRRRTQLDQFRNMRASLLQELREALFALEARPAGVRRSELETLAQRQAPRLADLEQAAEDLRRNFIDRDWLAKGVAGDWSLDREWKLGRGELNRPREQVRLFELQVMRSAVFYQEGLSPAQRRLLREAAMEFEDEIFRPQEKSQNFFVYFSPETARVHLPDDLSATTAEQLADYHAAKNELKAQLRDLVYEKDAVPFASERERAFRELAAQQAPRFAELEATAEHVRQSLAQLPSLQRSVRPAPLESDLEKEITAALKDLRNLKSEIAACLARAAADVSPPSARASPTSIENWRAKQKMRAREAVARFKDANQERLVALDHRLERLRPQLEAHWPRDLSDPQPEDPATLLETFARARNRDQANFEYHLAVLEPGLSPEQRRLLFGGAIELLDLPLPGPELKPQVLPKTTLVK